MKKKNLMKSLTALVLSVLMVLSLAACGAKPSDGGKDEDKDGYTVAIIKQMDHASLDEIADAIAARLDAIAQEQNVSIRYTITSGQGEAAAPQLPLVDLRWTFATSLPRELQYPLRLDIIRHAQSPFDSVARRVER